MNSENEIKDTTKTTTGYLIRTRSQTGTTEQDKIKETNAIKTMAATKDKVEALLREYRKNKLRSAEPGVFTGSISKNTMGPWKKLAWRGHATITRLPSLFINQFFHHIKLLQPYGVCRHQPEPFYGPDCYI